MVRPIVIAAVGSQHRQPVGVVPGTDEVIAGSLARGVRTIGLISMGFRKSRLAGLQRAINLISAHMQKAKLLPPWSIQTTPVAARRFQKGKGAHDVGLNEISGAMDGAVHMAFSRKVDKRPRLVLLEQTINLALISNIPLHEYVTTIIFQAGKIFQVTCVSKFIEVDDRFIMVLKPVEYKITANKTGTTSYKYAHNQIFRKIAASTSPILSISVCRYTPLRLSSSRRMGNRRWRALANSLRVLRFLLVSLAWCSPNA